MRPMSLEIVTRRPGSLGDDRGGLLLHAGLTGEKTEETATAVIPLASISSAAAGSRRIQRQYLPPVELVPAFPLSSSR